MINDCYGTRILNSIYLLINLIIKIILHVYKRKKEIQGVPPGFIQNDIYLVNRDTQILIFIRLPKL